MGASEPEPDPDPKPLLVGGALVAVAPAVVAVQSPHSSLQLS